MKWGTKGKMKDVLYYDEKSIFLLNKDKKL